LACERTYSFSLLILLHRPLLRTLRIGSCAWHSTAGQLVLSFVDTAGIRDGRSASPLTADRERRYFQCVHFATRNSYSRAGDGSHLVYFRPTQGQLYSSSRLVTSVGTVRTCFCASLLRVFKSNSDTVYPSSKLAVGRKLWAVLPMGLLWKFMGYSTAYTFFGGCAELLPAIFLLFRRTALLGSLLAFAVMLNVVMLNFCYDVPVKLYSLNLLLLSMFLVLPDTSRLFDIFVFNASAQPSNLREPVLSHNSVRRTALVLKFTVLAIFLVRTVASSVSRYREVEARTAPSAYPLTTRGFHWIQEEPYNR
jgi:hypothetical protein